MPGTRVEESLWRCTVDLCLYLSQNLKDILHLLMGKERGPWLNLKKRRRKIYMHYWNQNLDSITYQCYMEKLHLSLLTITLFVILSHCFNFCNVPPIYYWCCNVFLSCLKWQKYPFSLLLFSEFFAFLFLFFFNLIQDTFAILDTRIGTLQP